VLWSPVGNLFVLLTKQAAVHVLMIILMIISAVLVLILEAKVLVLVLMGHVLVLVLTTNVLRPSLAHITGISKVYLFHYQ